ncbi:hypothetical protein IFT78_014180 [Pantoea agglomerans]|nr:hypothetical protein [Pantoea agglomerans]WVL79234.1 hypothetical protein IFT78_014180 [Pantoea agglomerans]
MLVKNMPFTDSDKIKWWDNDIDKFMSYPKNYKFSHWIF